MKSKTKFILERHQIEQLCKEAFGNETQVGNMTELSDGMYNVSYLIELINLNNEVVLKVAPPPDVKILTYEQDIMKTELMVYDLIKNNTDIPIPEILYYNFESDIIPSTYFFMSKLNGQPLNKIKKLSDEDKKHIHEQLGKYTAQLHAIKGEFFGYSTFEGSTYTNTWRDAFLKMVKNILDDGTAVGIKFPMLPDQIIALLEAKASILDEIDTPKLTHFDLWGGNIFVVENNGKYEIEALIDCERAFWGDPHADFISICYIEHTQDIRKLENFIKGYNQVCNEELTFSDSLLCRLSMYRIYISLILIVEAKYRSVGFSFLFQSIFSRIMLKKELKEFKKLYHSSSRSIA